MFTQHKMSVQDRDPADGQWKDMGRSIVCLCPIGHDHTEDEFEER